MNEEQKHKSKFRIIGNIISFAIIFGIFAFLVYILAGPGPEKSPRDYNSCDCHSSSGRYVHANSPRDAAYSVTADELQNAVFAYASDHNGSFPILNSTYTNICCQNCSVINISAVLVVNGGLLRMAPDSCHLSAIGNDNCCGNASLGCSNYSSYIWLVNNNGSIFSYCAGSGCVTNNTCYQGVYP